MIQVCESLKKSAWVRYYGNILNIVVDVLSLVVEVMWRSAWDIFWRFQSRVVECNFQGKIYFAMN